MQDATNSSIIKLISDHWASLGTQSLAIPELGILIHWRPTTSADLAAINSKYESSVDRAVALIQIKALDADGNRLFDDGVSAFKLLRHQLPWPIVDRLSAAMMFSGVEAERLGEPSAVDLSKAES